MNKLIVFIVLAGSTAFAQVVTKEKVISDETDSVIFDMSTARCSHFGYSVDELKLSAPALETMAVFNHINPGETQPCISAGACTTGNEPGDVQIAGQNNVTAPLRVQRVEVIIIDTAANTCTRGLEERVSATIRGKTFRHLRSSDLAVLPVSLCQQF